MSLAQVAAALWRMLTRGAAVGAHLEALRALPLLGAGTFWQALLQQAPHRPHTPTHPSTCFPILACCQLAAAPVCQVCSTLQCCRKLDGHDALLEWLWRRNCRLLMQL